METNLAIAHEWINIGIPPIPLKYRGKQPDFRLLNNSNDVDSRGKPTWKKFQKEIPNKERINLWFKSRFVNLGIVTGHRGLVIIDFDDLPTFTLWTSWINLVNPQILKTYRVVTRRGQHIYLFLKNPPERTLKIKSNNNTTLIDIKAAGSYCAAPISIHPSGHNYTAINNPRDILTIESLEYVIPQNLLDKAVNNDVIISTYTGQQCNDVWSVTPCIDGGDSIKWIKQNRSILEFFPNALPSGGDRWYKVLCPFHDDHNESGWIDVKRNRFGCQNQCVGRGVDLIDFYCLLKNVDRSQAVRELSR